MTLSLIHRLGQKIRIMWNRPIVITSYRRAVSGSIAGVAGSLYGAWGAPLNILLIAAVVGASGGYLISAVIHWILALLSPPVVPAPLPPVNEARLLSVIEESGAVSLLCPSCLGRLAQGGVDTWLELRCAKCQAMARHRELQERAEARMRFGAAIRRSRVTEMDRD